MDKRSQLEAAWSNAYDHNQRHSTTATAKAEQDAWDAYTWECGERNECQHVGCRNITPQYAYCEEHRVA